MITMTIYEPAMCCSTGLCGVSVDPELLRISTVLNTLKKNGVELQRFNLSSAPQEFMNNKTVNEFIHTKGVDELPITVLDDQIVITGRYPTNEEFVKLLNIPMNYLEHSKASKSEACGCADGSCN